MELILKNKINIIYNVMTCLSFNDRYNLCITNKDYFENKFKKYKHQELIDIEFKDYLLTKNFLNIKFKNGFMLHKYKRCINVRKCLLSSFNRMSKNNRCINVRKCPYSYFIWL